MVVVAFFGVRHGAEVVGFQLDDISEAQSGALQLRVRCQKNDPIGIGQLCFIPEVTHLGKASPANLLRMRLAERRAVAQSSANNAPIFVTVTGRNKGAAISTDTLRKWQLNISTIDSMEFICAASTRKQIYMCAPEWAVGTYTHNLLSLLIRYNPRN